MITQGFETTNARIEEIRKEIELDRLKLLNERNELELKEATLKQESDAFEQRKEEHPELLGAAVGLAAGAGEKGMELLIEEEVKRRLKEEKDKRDLQEAQAKTQGVDLELKALETFVMLRSQTKIDLNNVSDDDSLADAMKAAVDLKQKKLLMRYKRLKADCLARDPIFTNKVLRNYFTLIRKVGTLWKRGGGFFGSWQQRFVVLTNAGLLYFKVDEMRKEEDLEPQNFKPLNDFVIAEVDHAVST